MPGKLWLRQCSSVGQDGIVRGVVNAAMKVHTWSEVPKGVVYEFAP
jgi:hypothetical protein